MKKRLLWVLIGLLVGSAVAAATLVQAGGNDKAKQTVEQESGENEANEVEDADEPGDDDGAGDIEDSDKAGEDSKAGESEDADEPGDDDGAGDTEDEGAGDD
jgi:hypothetical protein